VNRDTGVFYRLEVNVREETMRHRSSAMAFTLMTTLGGGAQAADGAKYPDWSGRWTVIRTPVP